MKNKTWLLFIGILIIGLIPSCKKGAQNCELGKYYVSDGNTTPAPSVFSYSGFTQMKRIVYANGTKDTISFNADSITILSYNSSDALVAVYTGVLNPNDIVTSAVKSYYSLSGTITGSDNITYEHDDNGQLTKQTTVNGSGTTTLNLYTFNANTDSATLFIGSVLNKQYFFYHSKVENKTRIDNLNGVFTPWLGNADAELLDSTHIIQTNPADTIRVIYNHTLDENGYVVKTAEQWFTPAGQTKITTYQYFDCR